MSDGRPFGAIMAGGESRRYGSPKAFAPVGGARIIDRVVASLRGEGLDPVLVANDPGLFAELALPTRSDIRPGLGALGGIHTALTWAVEARRPGVVAVACDMPFPCQPLLARLVERAFGAGPAAERPDVVIPESGGPRGVEPLFAAYGAGCLPAIEARLDAGDRRMIGFHDAVTVERIPRAEVAALCDLARAFLNVNTPAERDRAEELAGGGHGD